MSIRQISPYLSFDGSGGKVNMALNDTLWGARFGMLVDEFGIHWMFNCDLKKG
jgi:PhnB protein